MQPEDPTGFQNFENKVKNIIIKKFMNETIDYEIFTGFYKIDMYFPEYRLAIEVDGSSHYYGKTKQVYAKSLLKYKLYNKLGINYFVVDYLQYPHIATVSNEEKIRESDANLDKKYWKESESLVSKI